MKTLILDSESYVSIREIRELISSVSNARDKLMIRILYETGCSLVELVKIKVRDIMGNKIRFKDRYSKISGKLAKDIRNYVKGNQLQRNAFILSTRQSPSISEKRVRQLIQYYSKKFDKKVNPQAFRYYHIAHAYLNGVFIESIAKQLNLTKFRIFQILNEMQLKPVDRYNHFLKRL